jgi:hypothetical protein
LVGSADLHNEEFNSKSQKFPDGGAGVRRIHGLPFLENSTVQTGILPGSMCWQSMPREALARLGMRQSSRPTAAIFPTIRLVLIMGIGSLVVVIRTVQRENTPFMEPLPDLTSDLLGAGLEDMLAADDQRTKSRLRAKRLYYKKRVRSGLLRRRLTSPGH